MIDTQRAPPALHFGVCIGELRAVDVDPAVSGGILTERGVIRKGLGLGEVTLSASAVFAAAAAFIAGPDRKAAWRPNMCGLSRKKNGSCESRQTAIALVEWQRFDKRRVSRVAKAGLGSREAQATRDGKGRVGWRASIFKNNENS